MRLALLVILLLLPEIVSAQTALEDRNGDGLLRILAYGDSLTYGVGDGTSPGSFVELPPRTDGRSGYPARVRNFSGIEVVNAGNPGELISVGSDARFAQALESSQADIAVFLEGSNDAIFQVNSGQFRSSLQRMVNIAHALERTILIGTIPPTCCDRAGQSIFINAFNAEIRKLAEINQTPIFDLDRGFEAVCPSLDNCSYLNRPEGLHPNLWGYDLIAQLVLGSLYGIDLFAAGGSSQLEMSLGLEPGALIPLAPQDSGSDN